MDGKPARTVIKVRCNRSGWWEVSAGNGEIVGRFTSQFQAWEAGRIAAEDRRADLAMYQIDGPVRYEAYDPATRTMRPVEALESEPLRSPREPRTRRPLILLVEDSLDARELYAQYLTYAGFSVVTAINGHEGIRLARLLCPDLILMDLRMPGMDGLEATADLKRDPAVAHIPVIAMTADMSHEVNERARLAGCSAFLLKPALPNDIAGHVMRILAAQRQA